MVNNGYVYVGSGDPQQGLAELQGARVLALDVEGTGLNMGTAEPIGFSLSCSKDSAFYNPVGGELSSLLADPEKLYLAHGAKYDRSMMKKAGITVDNLCDTLIAAHLLGKPALSLKALALEEPLEVNIVAYGDLKDGFSGMGIQEMANYCCPHSAMAFALWPLLQEEMKELGLLDVFWKIEMPFVPVLSDMELNGVAVDADVLEQLGVEFDHKISMLVEALDFYSGQSGVNHNSPDQAADIIYNKLGIPPGRNTRMGKRPSVDARYLGTIKDKHPYLGVYLKYKQLKTLKHSYVESLRKQIVNGRVYGSFNQTRTRTGRLSSSGPNLQKIPERTPIGRRIRTAFVAPEGCVFVKADYDQIELRVGAHCSQDPSLLEAFLAGRDIHEETAIRAFGSKDKRSKGKTLNYQVFYGGGEVADREAFFRAYPVVKEWIKETVKVAREAGYVRTLGGRIRDIPELWSTYAKVQEHGDREAISTIVQGSTSEFVKIGMTKARDELKGSNVKGVLQVHDEADYEVPEKDVGDVIEVLKRTLPYHELSVPLTVSISTGKNWGEMEEIKSG